MVSLNGNKVHPKMEASKSDPFERILKTLSDFLPSSKNKIKPFAERKTLAVDYEAKISGRKHILEVTREASGGLMGKIYEYANVKNLEQLHGRKPLFQKGFGPCTDVTAAKDETIKGFLEKGRPTTRGHRFF